MIVTPKLAASVILVKETGSGAEALLVRKHADLAFSGGDFVFPGGKVESCDLLPDDLYRPISLAESDRGRRKPHIVALCRETFEEVGVLLARNEDGSHCEAAAVDALNNHRLEIHREPASFEALLRENRLAIHEEDFLYWSNWITPSLWPKRFDAHFYVAAMPYGQVVKCDTKEATELLWLDLGGFNEIDGARIIPSPPTLLSLVDLATCYRESGSLARLFHRECNRPIPRIMQKGVALEDTVMVLMPWHRDYEAAPGEGVDMNGIPDFYRRFPDQEVWPA